MGMILRIASSRIVGQGDIVGRSGYFSLNLSANSVMRGRLDARRTLKSLVADLRVKKETGKTAQEYIQNKIIDLAKEMIIGSGKTVSQIAYELGYQYSQHFNRVFKKNVGYTPSEYRHLQV